jgi:acetyl-CoA acetyltransferase
MLGCETITVGIVAYSHTKYGKLVEDIPTLLRNTIEGAISNVERGIDPSEIDLLVISNVDNQFSNQHQIGTVALRYLGNKNAEAFRVEAACASGGMATYVAKQMIESGIGRNALVVGVEKMTNLPTGVTTSILVRGGAPEEIKYGITQPAAYAFSAQLYMEKYGATDDDYAMGAVKNHKNAMKNPWAQFHKEFTVEAVKNSTLIASPIRLLHCSPITDGAAAILLSRDPKKYTDTPVYIKGMGVGYDTMGVFEREDPTFIEATRTAAEKAYKAAKIEPKQVQIAEVHDAFSPAEIMAYEALGFAKKGEGYKLLREGRTNADGDLPVNVSGGLKAKGHPIGATGVGMLIEVYLQLRGEAGERQISNVERGLIENHGGTGATAVVTVLGR